MPPVIIDRSQHRHYECDGQRYYSVSSVLDVVFGPTQWADEQAMQRGTDVHLLCALSIAAYAGLCAPPTVPAHYAGYLKSFGCWMDIAKPTLLEVEGMRVSTRSSEPVAGTFDLLCHMHDKGKRYPVLIDLKTGQPSKRDTMQVQAYGKLCPEAARLALLYLKKDGTLPTWKIVKPDPRAIAAFQSGLNILVYRESA